MTYTKLHYKKTKVNFIFGLLLTNEQPEDRLSDFCCLLYLYQKMVVL